MEDLALLFYFLLVEINLVKLENDEGFYLVEHLLLDRKVVFMDSLELNLVRYVFKALFEVVYVVGLGYSGA